MTTELAKADPPEAVLIPEPRALAMVKACAAQLELASSIPSILVVIAQADAISAVMQKIHASKAAQKAALRLRLEAEAHLGRITAQIPQGKRGAGAIAGQITKSQVLKENGIHKYRAGVAERLAQTPPEKVDAAIERAKTNGLYGVMHDLGIRKPWRDYQIPETTARHLGYLAQEAIELLERSVKSKTPPHAGTVREMRNRLTRLTARVP